MTPELASIFREESNIKDRLVLRAEVLTKIRAFFAEREVLEVETPLLEPTTNPAPFLNNFICDNLYLQTSPELAMKKLLASGSDDIYQICKAFRKGEKGRLHNPEFTILEWYRVNFDHHDLMKEMEDFLISIAGFPKAMYYTYQEICKKFLGINPHQSTLEQLKSIAEKNNLNVSGLEDDVDTWLQLLFTHLIEPNLGLEQPTLIYDFPIEQAMLAKISNGVASRFEVYYRGVELANGFHELNDAKEQRQRFNQDSNKRKKMGLPIIPLDEEFLTLLPKLPNCAGVALGIDRLLLLLTKGNSLNEAL